MAAFSSIACWLVALAAYPADGFPYYKDLIPNGHRVYFGGYSWGAVGHDGPSQHPGCVGRFLRNKFGHHFAEAQLQWTNELCKTDSDGDGITNGEELGDPNCIWVPGAPMPDFAGNISHPGINEASVGDRRDLSTLDLAARTRKLHKGEIVYGLPLVRHFGKRDEYLKDTYFQEMEVLDEVDHQVRVRVRPSAGGQYRALIPRSWINASYDGADALPQASFLQVHHVLLNPPDLLQDHETQEWLQEWSRRLDIVGACTEFGRLWIKIPVSQILWIFVNLGVPFWFLCRWRHLLQERRWPGLKVSKVCCAVFLISTVGISAGFHKLFTHRTFDATREVKWTFALLGQLALQGDAAYWSAMHRLHHRRCDLPGDPHSPVHFAERWSAKAVGANATRADIASALASASRVGWTEQLRGFFQAHGGFALNDGGYDFDYFLNTPEIRTDPDLKWITEQGILGVVGLPLLSHFIFGSDSTLLYLHVPQFLTWHAVQLINSWTHLWGYAPYEDAMVQTCISTNSPWLLAFSGGEVWHNNHHATPGSASFQEEWWEFDPAFVVIQMLEALGIIWDVRVLPRVPRPGYASTSPTQGLKSLVGFALLLLACRYGARTLGAPSTPRAAEGGLGLSEAPLGRLVQVCFKYLRHFGRCRKVHDNISTSSKKAL